MKTKSIFSQPLLAVFIALAVCLLWGSLYPTIKIGYQYLQIDSTDIPSVLLFAGLRFTLSGLLMILIFSLQNRQWILPSRKSWLPVCGVAVTNITLHYMLTYLALSIGEGSKSAIIKQVGFLFLSCLAFIFTKNEYFSARKLFCGILGFAGIIVTNLNGGGLSFALGDLLLIGASLCAVFGTVLSKRTVENCSPLALVAYSQLFGGVLLLLTGYLFGGKIAHVDGPAVGVFAYICIASILSYSLWNILIRYHSLSMLSIIKFTEPLFAVLLSGLLLHEDILKWNYVVALIMIAAAIVLDHAIPTEVKK
jgi:drug/metabolite transporter (DMT)-like permease